MRHGRVHKSGLDSDVTAHRQRKPLGKLTQLCTPLVGVLATVNVRDAVRA